jgi:hypothetical protein
LIVFEIKDGTRYDVERTWRHTDGDCQTRRAQSRSGEATNHEAIEG